MTAVEAVDYRCVEIEPGNLKVSRTASRRDTAEVPETENDDIHDSPALLSKTQGLSRSHLTVCTPPSRMESFGRQLVARILAVSRKINGLSPTQPREPPLKHNS